MMEGLGWDIFWGVFTFVWAVVMILFICHVTKEVKEWMS